jgi:hypothetical protein
MNQSGGGGGGVSPGETDDYTRYYMNQAGGGDIGSAYRASFRIQRGRGIGSFFRGLFRLVKPLLYSGARVFGKEALKPVSQILTDIIDKNPDHPMGGIFKSRIEVKDNVEQKIKKMAGCGLGLKSKRQAKKAQSHSRRSKVKDIFTAMRKKQYWMS